MPLWDWDDGIPLDSALVQATVHRDVVVAPDRSLRGLALMILDRLPDLAPLSDRREDYQCPRSYGPPRRKRW